MKFILKGPFKENVRSLMRRIGYHFQGKDEEKGELNFIHPIGKNVYPRLHLYLKAQKDNLIFNLHLDQRKPIYKGSPAHSGEYKGKIVEQEAARIKQILNAKN